MRAGYRTFPEQICPGNASLGEAYLLPWDSETFGFPVATYQPIVEKLNGEEQLQFKVSLHAWMEQNGVRLCSCSVPGDERFWKAFLPANSFQFVDLSLGAFQNDLRTLALMRSRVQLRPAERQDWEIVERIAIESFQHGRYHADVQVPASLSNLRYRHWIQRALTGTQPIDRVYVLERGGSVQGFYHFTVEGQSSDLRLAAISSSLQGSGLGFEMYLAVMHQLTRLGVTRATTTISATNTAILNVFARLGFRFSHPQAIYHWHADDFE